MIRLCCPMFIAIIPVLFLGSDPQVKRKHFQYLNYLGTGGAPSPRADIEKLLDKVGVSNVMDFYIDIVINMIIS